MLEQRIIGIASNNNVNNEKSQSIEENVTDSRKRKLDDREASCKSYNKRLKVKDSNRNNGYKTSESSNSYSTNGQVEIFNGDLLFTNSLKSNGQTSKSKFHSAYETFQSKFNNYVAFLFNYL